MQLDGPYQYQNPGIPCRRCRRLAAYFAGVVFIYRCQLGRDLLLPILLLTHLPRYTMYVPTPVFRGWRDPIPCVTTWVIEPCHQRSSPGLLPRPALVLVLGGRQESRGEALCLKPCWLVANAHASHLLLPNSPSSRTLGLGQESETA